MEVEVQILSPELMAIEIRGETPFEWEKAAIWASRKGAPLWFSELAQLYWLLASELGVRADGAYAQACKETNFGTYRRSDGTPSRVLNASSNNFCGMKTTAGGHNDDPAAHMKFPHKPAGVLAQLDHLNLYAGVAVTGFTYDPRHFIYLRGRATTFEALNNNWAGPDYGQTLEHNLLVPLIEFS